MTCQACSFLKKWTYGVLLADDELMNALAFGIPHTTVSQRAGWDLQTAMKKHKITAIVYFCQFLTWCQNTIAKTGLCGMTKNHCLDAIAGWPPPDQIPTDG